MAIYIKGEAVCPTGPMGDCQDEKIIPEQRGRRDRLYLKFKGEDTSSYQNPPNQKVFRLWNGHSKGSMLRVPSPQR
jgi:hypothetical protein